MAEAAAGLLGLVLEAVKWVSAPILHQFQYLCCFTANITALKHEADQLQVIEEDLQGKVDTSRNDVRIISGEVESWLHNSEEIKHEKDVIINEVPSVEGDCLKLPARFSLSKRAKKTTDHLKELRGQCKFDVFAISQPRPPPAMQVVPSRMTYEFESRKQIEEDIMATLRGGDVNMMGICGMGGLGKTTMATRIMNRALQQNVFEEAVMTVISQSIDKLKIQLEIGGSLGLKLGGEGSQARVVQKLNARLSGTKRILLVLDDVWEELDPEDLGIPIGYKGCTILLTSRNHDVLKAMNVQKIFGMEVLSVEDSWSLFKERVGTCVDDTKLNSIAKKVLNKCGGLPIAITTMGATLKDEVNVSIWEDALRHLRQVNLYIPKFISNVYNPLKLSYDVLGSKHKHVFLLCCLYHEDVDIPLDHLTYFCMGLHIFDEGNVEEARNRMHALTNTLINRSLLLDSKGGDDYVKMHGVVRDVCIFIAKQEKYIGDNDRSWTSNLQRSELTFGLGLLRLIDSQDKEFKFDGIRDLYVLSIEKCSLTSLSRTQTQNNLITLVIDSCKELKTLSAVKELVNLEILVCRDCDSIDELPSEIKGLNRLKVLDLTRCENLQRIGRCIISSLVGLEELKMLGSFNKWEGDNGEKRENAGLRELEVLTKLRCLEIEIENSALVAENIHLSSKLDRFTVKFLCVRELNSKFDEYLSKRKMKLNWEGAAGLGNWIEMRLLRDTACLYLTGNGASKVDLTKVKNIKMLELGRCESMKNVVASMGDGGGATVFPSIQHLFLFQLPKLEKICDHGVWLNWFRSLKELRFFDLPKLKQLWKGGQNDSGNDFLPQLEELSIARCEMMEEVFLWKGEDGNENNSCHHITIMFPKLKTLELETLPNLKSFCQGIDNIEFPLLSLLRIEGCKKMEGMVWNAMRSSNENNADTHELFCKVSFDSLKVLCIDRNPFCSHTIHVSQFYGLEQLRVSKCADSRNLFTSSIAANLANLRQLVIRDCDEMIEVIKDDEEKGMSATPLRLFPKLQELKLLNLPELESFCGWKCDVGLSIEFPLVRIMEIKECGKMKGMFSNGNRSSSDATDTNHLFCQEQVSFFSHTLFYGLEELTISKFVGSRSLFTYSIATNLVYLRELSINDCDTMVEVIKDDEEKHILSGTALLFPKLQSLYLLNLPELVSFCGWKCDIGLDIEFPLLRVMVIKECKKMKGMVSNVMRSSSNATDIHHLSFQQVSFSCLDIKLDIDRSSFCSHTIHVSLFNGLEELRISKCAGSRSLFTSSIAENLVNLKELWIHDCDDIIEVINDDEENGMSGTGLLFPELHTLQLSNLPELESFCGWKCDVELISLRKVSIFECPKMKNFTLGTLAAPTLESILTRCWILQN